MWSFLLTFFISTLLGELLRPKPKFNTPSPSALGEFQMPTAEYGRALPVIYGKCWMKAPNVVWHGDLRVEAITEEVDTGIFSSETITKGYKYHMGAQLAWCAGFSAWELEHGSGLVEYRFDEKSATQSNAVQGTLAGLPNVSIVFNPNSLLSFVTVPATPAPETTAPTSPSLGFVRTNINAPGLFGGEEKEGGFVGTIDFHAGQATQAPSDYLLSVFGRSDISAYRGCAYSVVRRAYWGTSSYIKPISAIVQRFPWFWPSTENGWNVNGDANPIAIIVDLLTNGDYGLGLPVENLGFSFKAAAMACYAEGLGLSMIVDTQIAAKDFLDDVLRHVDGTTYTDPATQKLEIALARANYNADELVELNPENVVSLEMTRASWNDTKNVIKIKYTDRARDFQTAIVSHRNQANIDMRGGLKDEETYSFLGISNVAMANNIAVRVLKTVGHPLARFSIVVNRIAHDMRPGSVFRLNWPELGVAGMVCRATRISYGGLTDPSITLEAVEDIFGLLETTYPAPTGYLPPFAPPDFTGSATAAVYEAPYHFVGSKRAIMTLCARPNDLAVGYKVYSDASGAMIETADVKRFTPTGTLAVDFDHSSTQESYPALGSSITISGLTDADRLSSISEAELGSGKNIIMINDELLAWQTITANTDGTHTLGNVWPTLLDSQATDYYARAGAQVWFISAGYGLTQSAGFATDKTVSVAIQPYALTSEQAPAGPFTVTTNSRALRPFFTIAMPTAYPYWPSGAADLVFKLLHNSASQQRAAGFALSLSALISKYPDLVFTQEYPYKLSITRDYVVVRTINNYSGNTFNYTKAMQLDDGFTADSLASSGGLQLIVMDGVYNAHYSPVYGF